MAREPTWPKPTRVPGIVQLGPERFRVRARWTDQRTGRRIKKQSMAPTLAEAIALKENLVADGVQTRQPTRQRFLDYAEQWMQLHGNRLARSTQDRYIGSLAHISVHFGQYYVDSIIPSDVRTWVAQQAKKYAPATINGRLRVMRQCLDDAVEDGLLSSNPARIVRAIPEGRTGGKRGTALSKDEFRRMLISIDNLSGQELASDVARLLKVIAWTGLRKGEALALKWSDYLEGELRITRSVWRGREKTTKTGDPRIIAVVEPLQEVLTEQRHWLMSIQHPGLASGLMFPASPKHVKDVESTNWYRSPTAVDKALAKVVKDAGIPPISAHSLRRTFENLMRAAGVDQLVRRALAGWRSEKAQAIYASVDRDERDAAANAVVNLVKGTPL